MRPCADILLTRDLPGVGGHMEYVEATAELLAPLIVYTRREDFGDLVTFAARVQLDDEQRAALARDTIDEMDRTGKTRAWRASAQ